MVTSSILWMHSVLSDGCGCVNAQCCIRWMWMSECCGHEIIRLSSYLLIGAVINLNIAWFALQFSVLFSPPLPSPLLSLSIPLSTISWYRMIKEDKMCPFLLLGELVLINIAAQTDQFNELIIHLSNTLLTASIKVLLLNILPTDRDLNEAHLSVNPTQQETLMSREDRKSVV